MTFEIFDQGDEATWPDQKKDNDKDKDKDKYMGLSLLCGKIYRTVKYQYFGWFEEPIIKIEVLEYV